MRELAGKVMFLALVSILLAFRVPGFAPFLQSDAVKCQQRPQNKVLRRRRWKPGWAS